MVAALLTSSSTLLTAHSTVGCSTGYMDELREDWDALVTAAAQTSGFAIELSALCEDELDGLIAYLRSVRRLPFRFVSVHGPSKDRRLSDDELVSALEQLPAWVSAIVMHPDAMVDLAPYRRLGRRLCIENMDPRKHLGQTGGGPASATSTRCRRRGCASTSRTPTRSMSRSTSRASCCRGTRAGSATCTSARSTPSSTTCR